MGVQASGLSTHSQRVQQSGASIASVLSSVKHALGGDAMYQ